MGMLSKLVGDVLWYACAGMFFLLILVGTFILGWVVAGAVRQML
jgi:hypothetical protein